MSGQATLLVGLCVECSSAGSLAGASQWPEAVFPFSTAWLACVDLIWYFGLAKCALQITITSLWQRCVTPSDPVSMAAQHSIHSSTFRNKHFADHTFT